jgi:beta-lactamase regulating signal transducer with metallopeptidase domain
MLWWLAQTTVMAAALAGLVALVCLLGRLRPAVRHALWLVVLVKLLTPPGVAWPWPLPDFYRPPPAPAAARAEPAASLPEPGDGPSDRAAEVRPDGWLTKVAGPILPPAPPPKADRTVSAQPAPKGQHPEAVSADLPAGETAPPPVQEGSDTRSAAADSPRTAAWWRWDRLLSLAVYLWVGGVLAMAGLQLARIGRFRRLAARGRPAPAWLTDRVAELASRLGVRPPRALVVPGGGSPVVWCLGRPKLLVPDALLGRLAAECWPGVILHELAHLRRRDHWVGWLKLAAGCQWWWNPLFWYVCRQLHDNAELACDAWVVEALPQGRRAYAEALLAVSQVVSRAAAPVPALGMARAGARRAFERRLTMIMRGRGSCRLPLRALAAVGLLALVTLPGCSQPTEPAAAAAEPAAGADLQQRLAVARLDAIEKEIVQVQSELTRTRAALAVLRAREKASATMAVADAAVEELIRKDPEVQNHLERIQMLQDQLTELKRVYRDPRDAAIQQREEQLASAQKALAARREQLRSTTTKQVRDRTRREIRAQADQLQERTAVLQELEKALTAEAQKLSAQIKRLGDEKDSTPKEKKSSSAKPLTLEESLRKARADGKYEMLLRQIKVPADADKYGSFHDLGRRDQREYAGHQDLPAGHWVYVAPYWYIWRDLSAAPKPKRQWGPEQATGPPDTWPMSGDIPTAWASLTEDGQDEWLLLEYAEPVRPNAVLVYETFNPGAVNRVTVFKLDGEEVEVFKGKDPSPTDKPTGLSVIPIKVNFKINRIKLYINSKDVPGWNEVDAVGLREASGKVHWATAADASSTYAQLVAQPVPLPNATEQRLDKLEKEVRELKEMVKQLTELLKKKDK